MAENEVSEEPVGAPTVEFPTDVQAQAAVLVAGVRTLTASLSGDPSDVLALAAKQLAAEAEQLESVDSVQAHMVREVRDLIAWASNLPILDDADEPELDQEGVDLVDLEG